MQKLKQKHKHHHPAHLVHLTKKQRRTAYENTIMTASYVYPLTGIPQLIYVFQGKIDGVSAVSWAGFAAFSLLFLTYSLKHKVKPMIVVYSLWLVIDLLVVVGVLYYRMTN